jgi:oligopeptide transport system ATP-binding protein
VDGEVLFEGEDLVKADDDRLRDIRGNRISMVFQEPMTSLNPVLTVGRQLTETLELHMNMNKVESRQRAAELLEMVGIPDADRRLNDYPHQFSGGMRQRVMIAMALSCDPKLIIADEPTTALDVTIQAQILELMQDLSKELGTALIIITHNLGVVARYADRVIVMYAGKIVETASAIDLYQKPQHPYTLALLNSVPRLDSTETRVRLDAIDGLPPNLSDLPAGCNFAPRCRFAKDECLVDEPELRKVSSNHSTACIRSEEIMELVGSA